MSKEISLAVYTVFLDESFANYLTRRDCHVVILARRSIENRKKLNGNVVTS